ncbi:unnamed protein product (macronuclear) [Paramecium tetraurelia]|uniref:Protein kinase domain-containing protein n=1 Tax=Paramecium tetraurelia TaxID=5888 RepID=A0D9M9_PARTE|nr:uncharacterized protein GSPATT00014676001 [Paramecium tetraurelia]CAK79746.1 unnamed protein product [Paramecium tetraurelia]|eukprot:XP_001447143.1 hypothetical protein (macronuclear) [Paramecium tetraurelia strain d4-2]
MNNSLYFVSSERQSFWNKNLKSLVNYDFHKLSEDQQTIVLFKQGQLLKRTTPRRYKIYHQHLFYFQVVSVLYFISDLLKNGEIGGFLILKNVYCSFRNKENLLIITLSHDQSQLQLFTSNRTEEVDNFMNELKLNCIQEQTLTNFYKINEKIGEGITSEVFLGSNQDNQKFAIKKVAKAQLGHKMRDKQAKSLAEEIFIMRSLDYSNIPKLYEVFENEDYIGLVMTHYEGGQLQEKLQNLNLSQKQQLVKNLLETMNYVHSQSIMHRDLKPQNIMYKNKDPTSVDIAIIDFGFATNQKYQEHVLYNCGTPGYAAPEVQEYKEKQKMYATQCDVYSLGIIIYEMQSYLQSSFFGVHPFRNSNPGSLTFNEKVKVPQSLKNLLIQMTRIQPKQRFTLKECLDQDFFRENFDSQGLDGLSKYSLVDSIYQKSFIIQRKNSIEHSIKQEKMSKLESAKNKTINSTAAESKNILLKSQNQYDQQFQDDLQFNEYHNYPNDFNNLLQKRI